MTTLVFSPDTGSPVVQACHPYESGSTAKTVLPKARQP